MKSCIFCHYFKGGPNSDGSKVEEYYCKYFADDLDINRIKAGCVKFLQASPIELIAAPDAEKEGG